MKKVKKEKRMNVMTPLILTLFIITLLLFMNIQSVSYFLNTDSYRKVSAKVVRQTTDPFTMIIPMLDISYQYNGTEYEDTKLFVLQPFFGISSESGDEIEIYVNRKVPNYCLFVEPFYKNTINWFLVLFGVVFLEILIKRIVVRCKRRRQRKLEKEAQDGEDKDISE